MRDVLASRRALLFSTSMAVAALVRGASRSWADPMNESGGHGLSETEVRSRLRETILKLMEMLEQQEGKVYSEAEKRRIVNAFVENGSALLKESR